MAKVINHFLPKPPNLGTKTVTENGTVTAASEGLDGFSQVTVNVASSGDGGWQPDPLWTDIRDLWDEDTLRKRVASGVTFYSDTALTTSVGTLASSHPVTSVEATYGTMVGDGTDGTAGTTYYVAIADVTGTYIYSAIYLISASDLTTVFKKGARYITSDGYDSTTELASDYTHTWDLTDDMIDSNGAYTRWIKVYKITALSNPYNFNNKVLWCIYNLGTTIIGSGTESNYQYLSNCPMLVSFTIKDNITSLGDFSFYTTRSLINIELSKNITVLNEWCFYGCNVSNLIIPKGVTSIGKNCFGSSFTSIKSVLLPNTITSLDSSAFSGNNYLLSIVLENNFNTAIKINDCFNLSVQVVVAMLTALFDRSALSAYTITLPIKFSTMLTTEQKAIATNKNWTIAYA